MTKGEFINEMTNTIQLILLLMSMALAVLAGFAFYTAVEVNSYAPVVTFSLLSLIFAIRSLAAPRP